MRHPGPVLAVTPNPALDTTYSLPALVPGRSHRVAAPVVQAGGKGLNVARVIHQSGYRVHAVLPIGGESGFQLSADLAASGIPHSVVDVGPPTRRSITVVDQAAGSATLLNEEGCALTSADWERVLESALVRLPASGCVSGSGSLPPETPQDFYASLVRAARSHGLPTVIDATGQALLEAARAGATVVKPNRDELLESTGESDPARGAKKLLALGARLVLVSLGEDGMLAFDARDPAAPWHARFSTVLAGNPTGAGDAAVAAVAVMLAQGSRSVPDLLRAAAAWSAAAVLMPTAGVLHPDYAAMAGAVEVRSPASASGTASGTPPAASTAAAEVGVPEEDLSWA